MFILLKSGAMFNLFWLQDCFQGKHNKNVVIFYCINGSKVIEEYDTEAEARQRVEDIRFNMSESSAGDTRPLIVEELPTENISTRRSYLIRVSDDSDDGYQEWRYIEIEDGVFKWDMLGVTKDYAYSKEEIDEQFENYYTQTEVDESQQAQDNTISALTDRVSTNETDITNIKAEQITQNTNISTNTSTIASNKADIEGKLNTAKTELESADTALSGRITTNATAISDLTTTVSNNKLDIEGKLTDAVSDLEDADEALDGRLITTETKLETIESGAQVNIIESISVNNTAQTITNKNVDISVPTNSDIDGRIDTKLLDYTTTSDMNTLLDGKVDKVTGKQLSTNDYTTTEKTKLSDIEALAQVNIIESISVNGTTQTITNKDVDITIPTNVSDLNNDSGFGTYTKPNGGIPKTDLASEIQDSLDLADSAIQTSDLTNYVQNTDYATTEQGGVIKTNINYATELSTGSLRATTKDYTWYSSANNGAIIGKGTLENVITGKNLETADNKVTTISSSSTNTEYPTAKAVYDLFTSIVDGDEVSY